MLQTFCKKNGWDYEIYLAVYNKCDGKILLKGDECHTAQHLAEFGFLEVRYVPIWVNGSYTGRNVFFKQVKLW